MNAYNLLGRDLAASLQQQVEYMGRRAVRRDGTPIRPDEALQFGYALNAAVEHIFKGYAEHYSKALNQAQTAADLEEIAESCTRQLHFAIDGAVSNEGKLYQIAVLHAHNQIAVTVCGEYLREDFPGARICFFGHTHEQRVFEVIGDAVRDIPPSVVDLCLHRHYFVNPGSVDASRKRHHKLAEFAVFDSEALTVDFANTPYDERRTEERAHAGGYRIAQWRDRLYDVQRRLTGS